MELGNLHEYVAVGGTFDHLHQGHKVLLSCAAAIATRGLVVGISGDPLLREKAAASHLQSWGDRARTVAAFLSLQRPDLTVRLEELSDAFGPSLRPELGALVVSAETEVGGHAVNQKRQELQRSTLHLLVVPLVIDRAGEKMSSSTLRLDHDLLDAFWQCWTRTELKVQGTRWSQLLLALAKMAGQVLVGRSRSLCEQHLSELAMGQSRITALARCLDFLFATTGPELLNVMVSDFAMDADTENQLRRELQKLSVLKFLGTAIPIAMQDPELPAERIRDLCRLAVQKKLRPNAEAAIAQDLSEPEELLEHLEGGKDASAIWVCNGRRIDLQVGGQAISARHVHALELLEGQYDMPAVETSEEEEEEDSKEADVTTKALSEWLADADATSSPASVYGLVAAIRSEVLSHAKHERFTQPAKIFDRAPNAFRVKIPPAQPDAASPITVYGILDPLSTTAQSASAALALFGMAFNAEVNLVLNPAVEVEEYPLKRYYREVVRWPERLADGRLLKDVADEANTQVGRGIAEFTLATQHTLTAAVHALPTWLVTAHEAEHDMDNLRPVDVLSKGGHCQTTYALRQLYVEGQAMILGDEGWPIATAKGMQFEITGTGALEASDDTIVMGNLGYFQR
eukprot:symbB.v1.2.027711.t1/scaffold2861.1/size68641/1